MGISVKEGLRLAEQEAWRTRGKEHAWWFTTGKRVAPYIAGAGVVLALIAGAAWVWRKVAGALGSIGTPDAPNAGGVPGFIWVGLLALSAASVMFFLGIGRARRFSLMLLQGAALLASWFGLLLLLASRLG